MLTGEVVSAFEGIRAALDTLDAVDLDGLPAADVLDIAQLCETMARKNTVLRNDLALTLSRCPVEDVGGPAHRVLADFLRITPGEARHRMATTTPLTPRANISGPPLPPHHPATAAAWRRGELDDAHVRAIQKFFKDLPASVADAEKDCAEAFLAESASQLRPDQLAKVADRHSLTLNPDGNYSDKDPCSPAWLHLVTPRPQRYEPRPAVRQPRTARGVGRLVREIRGPRHVQSC